MCEGTPRLFLELYFEEIDAIGAVRRQDGLCLVPAEGRVENLEETMVREISYMGYRMVGVLF